MDTYSISCSQCGKLELFDSETKMREFTRSKLSGWQLIPLSPFDQSFQRVCPECYEKIKAVASNMIRDFQDNPEATADKMLQEQEKYAIPNIKS